MTQPSMSAGATASSMEQLGLPAAAAGAVRRESQAVALAPGTVLFRPGDVCRGYLLPTGGRLRVSLSTASGREVVLYRVGAGEVCLQTFQCLATGHPYGAEGRVEETVSGWLLPPAAFDRMLAAEAGFRRFVLMEVARRFASLTETVELTAFTPLPARLAMVLLARPYDAPVAMTHADLAAEIGSAREVVSRQLSRWEAAGLVGLTRGRIAIHDRTGLARIAAKDSPV